jgi:hypothetical protein
MSPTITDAAVYEAARAFVAAVNDPAVPFADESRLGRTLDRYCAEWATATGHTGEPTGRLREAAMNGWPLPEVA